MLVSASGDHNIKLWNLTTNLCVGTFQGHQQALVKVAWLNAGLQFASASVDGIVKVWNVKKQLCLNTFEMHEEKIWALDFSENLVDNSILMLTGGSDGKVKRWEDCTVEQELESKEAKMVMIGDELKLSKLMRENDLVAAALLAFKLNKLRDFFHAMNRLVCGKLMPSRAAIPGLMLPGVAT